MPPIRRLFPPLPGVKLENKGRRGLDVLTAGGEIRLKRKYFWGKGAGSGCPADALAGVEKSDVTPGARQLCALMGLGQDFDQSRRDLKRVGGLSVGKERMRQIVEGEGKQARKTRDMGQLPAAWTADEAELPDGRTRVYGGVDGVMAPTVTQVEKDKRRRQHVARRQQRGKAGVGNLKPLAPPKAGSDERFKEMKIGIFYDQDKTRRHVFATENPSREFGALLASHARQIGFERADESIFLVDGAKWIYRQICSALLCLQVILLDFYHLAEHVHGAARVCLGEGETARSWASQRLAQAKASDVPGILAAIAAMGKTIRSPAKRESLRQLREYIQKRRDILGYKKARANGWDIGSGPTEATCKTLTLRLKRPGMKWDRDNAAAMMNLMAMRESGQWDAYWKREASLAA